MYKYILNNVKKLLYQLKQFKKNITLFAPLLNMEKS